MTAELLTASEVAKLLKCSRASVYRMHAAGTLMARYKLFEGYKGLRWVISDIETYLNRKSVAEEKEDPVPPFKGIPRLRQMFPVN